MELLVPREWDHLPAVDVCLIRKYSGTPVQPAKRLPCAPRRVRRARKQSAPTLGRGHPLLCHNARHHGHPKTSRSS